MPNQSGLLTPEEIAGAAVQLLRRKVPLSKLKVFSDREDSRGYRPGMILRVGAPSFESKPSLHVSELHTGWDVTLIHQAKAFTHWPTDAMRMNRHEFSSKYLDDPTDVLAAKINGDVAEYKTLVLFGGLCLPEGIHFAVLTGQPNDILLRLARIYDINTDQMTSRFDVLYGGI